MDIYDSYDYQSTALSNDVAQVSLPAGGMNDWGAWTQDLVNKGIGVAIDSYKYRTQGGAGFERGQDGRYYPVGQKATPVTQQTAIPKMAIYAGIGLAVIAGFLILKK